MAIMHQGNSIILYLHVTEITLKFGDLIQFRTHGSQLVAPNLEAVRFIRDV